MQLNTNKGNPLVNTTSAVAASAVTSPFWLPWLTPYSEGAAVLAPILGVVWLFIQIVAKVREMRREGRK